MRKNIVARESRNGQHLEQGWLDLGNLAQVEITSEDPTHPIESALQPDGGAGWRAAEPGLQVIRLLFDHPISIKRILVVVEEQERSRTQEFVLRWSQDQGRSYRELVRQQYNFNPPGTISEEEEYTVNLTGVTALQLDIQPDMSGSDVKASLARLRLA
jgi:hypothetical protein